MRKSFILIIILFIAAVTLTIFLFDDESLLVLSREDGVFEWTTSILYFLSFLLFAWSYVKGKKGNDLILFRTRKNIIFFVLAIIMFLAAGEELSWGQRILHVKTPDFFAHRNIQKEINLHNLDFLQPRDASGQLKKGIAKFASVPKIFLVFCFFFFLLIPLTNAWVPWLSKKYDRFNIPVLPVWIGVLYFISFILFMAIDGVYIEKKSWWLAEISECNDSMFFFVSSAYFVFGHPRGGGS